MDVTTMEREKRELQSTERPRQIWPSTRDASLSREGTVTGNGTVVCFSPHFGPEYKVYARFAILSDPGCTLRVLYT